MNKIRIIDLNRLRYNQALYIQQKLFAKVKNNAENHQNNQNESVNYLLFVEHEPVYTIGIRDKQYQDKDLRQKLEKLGADFVQTNRGGLITFHGHGQLVAYPIMNLKQFPIVDHSIKKFVYQLESSIIDLLKEYNIDASRLYGYPGVWVDNERKIAALGLHCSQYVTMHGVAINCDVNLNWYDHIVPCGIEDKSVTSISKELNKTVGIDQIKPLFLKHFSKNLDCTIEH